MVQYSNSCYDFVLHPNDRDAELEDMTPRLEDAIDQAKQSLWFAKESADCRNFSRQSDLENFELLHGPYNAAKARVIAGFYDTMHAMLANYLPDVVVHCGVDHIDLHSDVVVEDRGFFEEVLVDTLAGRIWNRNGEIRQEVVIQTRIVATGFKFQQSKGVLAMTLPGPSPQHVIFYRRAFTLLEEIDLDTVDVYEGDSIEHFKGLAGVLIHEIAHLQPKPERGLPARTDPYPVVDVQIEYRQYSEPCYDIGTCMDLADLQAIGGRTDSMFNADTLTYHILLIHLRNGRGWTFLRDGCDLLADSHQDYSDDSSHEDSEENTYEEAEDYSDEDDDYFSDDPEDDLDEPWRCFAT